MHNSTLSADELRRRIDCALGRTPCDLVLRNACVFNVFTKSFTEHADIAIDSGVIVDVGTNIAAKGCKEVDLNNAPLVPGFIDAHVHIESSMLRPREFARLILSKGTTAIVADPHEIANVCGLEGIRFMIEDARDAAVDIRFMLPSCVPATPFETSGATLTADELQILINEPAVLGLAEVMNVPAVLAGEDDMLAKILLAARAGKAVDGCHDRGVCRRESDRRFEGILLLGSGICLQCVDSQRIEQQRIFRQRQGVGDQRVESRISLGTPTLRIRTLRNERQHHDKQKRYI